jgi:AraC family transcriptional regulator, ethanolamine operon transcriptional activator
MALDEGKETDGLSRSYKRIVTRIEDLIRSEEPRMSVPEICLRLGESRRTVERAFRQELDSSPAQYLLKYRLCRAREDLIRGGHAVTNIATKHGFYELGRFSMRYRQLFGELPSETLASRTIAAASIPLPQGDRPRL